MIRLTGGAEKGRVLASPPKVRVTEAKVRQALFNILGQVIKGARFLDGCAGSGVVGCEALSRGAAYVAFIDCDAAATLAIQENLQRCHIEIDRGVWRVIQLDIERGLAELAKRELPFDVVFFDPPYHEQIEKKALNALEEYAILAPTGILVVEHHQRTLLPEQIGPGRQVKRHRYGDTVLSFYQAD